MYNIAQLAEQNLNRIAKAINKTFVELKCILKGFEIYFV